ncbi:hypothetical protein E1286_38280 [Nonomuraea terrae]|uniref:Tn3 transposase DDE domain-containing protein n=2 Tax=Nonomuraea terrae TaxID=2530383 RepID=A0A4R4XY39_9ACTN|nr:hypothetical protein E1286_38280 [Nonomuraea terrae]
MNVVGRWLAVDLEQLQVLGVQDERGGEFGVRVVVVQVECFAAGDGVGEALPGGGVAGRRDGEDASDRGEVAVLRLRMIQRDGNPTPLGDAIAHYGRIFKTLHILTYAVEEPYRRDIKGIRNLQESRHALAGKIFHGRKGEIYQRYHKGMEEQLGALGLVLNCVTLWNTFYMDKALDQLKAERYPLGEEDVARLSPFVRRHINVIGTYSFTQPDLGPTGMRQLRDPDEPDWDDDGL